MEFNFTGLVTKGSGLFAIENSLSDISLTAASIDGWPGFLVPGTFNIKITKDLAQHEDNSYLSIDGFKAFDLNPTFQPFIYLSYSAIPDNTLNPETKGDKAGDLQFWKAILSLPKKDISHKCYMLRRVRSGYSFTIELVSNLHIRTCYGLKNGEQVNLTVFSGN